MTTSTWVQQSISGSQATGSALPVITLDIPANKTLKRVVVLGHAGGVQNANGAVTAFSPAYFLCTLSLGFPTTGLKEIWHARRLLQFSAVAIDDHNLLTQNRVYSIYHGAGDRELGDNLQMSWGGPVSPAMRLTTASGFFNMVSASTSWIVNYTILIRALYQA